jgi:NAD-dependent dihydropyrimidine dehydrogenase PreA subunit
MSEVKSSIKSTWFGIPREQIEWHPTVEPELCMGCGICVLGCGRGVYRFDYANNVPVVAYPLNCLVGCTTCANTCPQHAIGFPPASYLHKIIRKHATIQQSKRELTSKIERYEYKMEKGR